MRCNTERFIEALIATEVMVMQQREAEKIALLEQKARTYVVTVSRDFGSMGKEVAQLLADTLEVRCCDRFILQEVARKANVDEKIVSVLDEHVKNFDAHWWQHLLHKDAFTYEDYYQNLVKTIIAISHNGGVIVGRGANFILGANRAFRIRIAGSEQQCARRVARREQISNAESTKRVREVNSERAEYIRMLYKHEINDHSAYDLVLNSDRYDRVQMVELILDAMEKAGYKLPEDARKSLRVLAHTDESSNNTEGYPLH
jgi:cytidylate kinase